MWYPADVGFLWIAFPLTGGALLVFAHLRATGAQPMCVNFHATLDLFTEKATKHVNRSPDFQRRFSGELLEARGVMLKSLFGVLIHFAFLLCLTMAWMFLQEPSFSSLCYFLASLFGYGWSFFAPEMAKTESQFCAVQALLICIQTLLVIGITQTRDLASFDVGEKIATINTVIFSLAFIDFKMTMPFYVCQSAVLTYCRWSLIGVAQITSFMIFVPLVSYAFVGAISALSVLYIHSSIAAKLDAGEVASLMLGFRQILRGVCDGDLILDRRTMTIVDDAICLERVLKSEGKLSNSNFLDLFLDSESRQTFSDFLQAEYPSQSSMPRGLRVSLQGARGPVSMDLFYTALPRLGASSDWCLLAMKEDPLEQLQTAPPEAPPNSAPERIRQQPDRILPERSGSRSSTSERVVAHDDLSEIGLLVSDATGFMDIEQVHLSFKRKSKVSNIESGMPTLRKFIRPADWDRIEQMFSIVTNLQPPDRHERCYFRRPTFFRVPGESRRYLCARHTSLRLADESPGRPTRHFWMHLGEFDLSKIHRLWEGQLENVEEEQ